MPDRLVKKAILARSGIYQYQKSELKNLGLESPPPWVGDKESYKIKRPSHVIAVAVERGKFNHLPLTDAHPPEFVTQENFRKYTVGWTGDQAIMDYLEDKDEAIVRSTVVIGDEEAANDYELGVRQLSHGYTADFRWRREEEEDTFDAVMVEINDGNHIALIPKGRAEVAAILDHKEGDTNIRKFLSALWHKARRRAYVKDQQGASQAVGFGPGLRHLIEARATKYPEELKRDIENVRELVVDLPDGDEKSLLLRYMDDFAVGMKDEKDDVLQEAVSIACALYDKLDKAAMEEGEMEDAKDAKDCKDCYGTGKIKDKDCPACGGTGKAKDEVKEPPKAEIKEPPKAEIKGAPGTEGEVDKPDKESTKDAVKDEPGPEPPPAVPPAPPKPPAAATPAPAAPAATPAAPQGAGAEFWMKQLATLLQAMMNDPAVKAMVTPAQPAAAPAAPATPAAPTPAPGPTPPPGGAPQPPAKTQDSMPSLTATISPSGGDAASESGRSLEGILNSILNKGKKG